MFDRIKKALNLGNDNQNSKDSDREINLEVSISVTGSMRLHDTSNWIDERRPECPTCLSRLAKIPGAKTKCPKCGEYMYVRNDPRTESRRVVPESELEPIQEAWAEIEGRLDEYLASRELEKTGVDNLKAALGREPTKLEIVIDRVRVERPIYLKNKELGMYRNTFLEEAEAHYKDKNYRDALTCFLLVVLLDGNGCSNVPAIDPATYQYLEDPDVFRGFNQEDISYLPHFADRIRLTLKRGELSLEQGLIAAQKRASKENFGGSEDMRTVWAKFASATNFQIGTKD
jgi:predicted RNA-binding Zn-ribbon protein involved in translation (DUF1610 family)